MRGCDMLPTRAWVAIAIAIAFAIVETHGHASYGGRLRARCGCKDAQIVRLYGVDAAWLDLRRRDTSCLHWTLEYLSKRIT
jgi:hypothetical protein